MRSRWIPCVAGISAFFVVSVVAAETLFVDPSVADGGDGSRNAPLRTLGKALDRVAGGDVIRLRKGTYREALAVATADIRIGPWGEGRPSIVPPTGKGHGFHVAADGVEIGGIEILAATGLHVAGDRCIVRDVVFNGCEHPLLVRGHFNVVANNRIEGCAFEGPGRLLEVIGDHNAVVENFLVGNDGPNATGIFCQGYGTKVINNVIHCDPSALLRFGIVSSSLAKAAFPPDCRFQEISHNRVLGPIAKSMILVEGPAHDRSSVHHNTLVATEKSSPTGIEFRNVRDTIIVTYNLVTGAGAGIWFDVSGDQQCDHNNLFGNERDIVSTGTVRVGAGDNVARTAVKFGSLDPESVLFLSPVSPAQEAVDTGGPAPRYAGARSVGPALDHRNLAFGKTLRFREAPRLEADEMKADGSVGASALYAVDGFHLAGDGFMWWEEKSRLGWHTWHRFDMIVDLGEIVAIDAARLNMTSNIARTAFLPFRIRILVSDDDGDYYPVGEITRTKEVLDGNYLLEAADLKTRGRYMLFEILPNGTWPCMDEIEIARGDHDPKSVQFAFDRRVQRPHVLPLGATTSLGAYGRYTEELHRFAETIDEIERLKGPAPEIQAARGEITTVSLDQRPADNGEKPEVREAIFRACNHLAPVLFAGRGGYVLSASNPYGALDSSKIPVENRMDVDRVEIMACRNEVEPGSFLVTNAAGRDLDFAITVGPLATDGGRQFPADRIELRHPVEAFHSNALVKLDHGEGNRLVVPGGRTWQIWISVDTAEVPAGTYRGKVSLSAKDVAVKHVELVIRVHPVTLSDRTSLRIHPWMSTGGPKFRHDVAYSVHQLRSHKVNTVNEHSYTPWPGEKSFDAAGHLVKPIDYSVIDTLVNQFDRQYFNFYLFKILFEYEEQRNLCQDDLEFGSVKWETAVREWINDWTMHLDQDYGITTDQFALYLYDEPVVDQIENLMAYLGKVLRTADPKKYPYVGEVKIFVNPMEDTIMSTGLDRLKAVDPYIDIICPAMSDHYPQEVLDDLRKNNELWGYVGLSRGPFPYPTGRLIAWRAMKQGLTGIGFWVWAYNDQKNDAIYGFNENVPGAGDEPVVPSRGWEAWRDGVDDYELLEKLKTIAEKGAEMGLALGEQEEARRVFDRALSNVLDNRNDPDQAIQERENIIAAIMQFAGQEFP